jgi:NAD(P)-dependent dehydrogenase (short-subunit alcohol dehydrogenase family)
VLQVDLSTVFTICRDIGAYIPTRKPNSSGHRGSIINVASLVSLQGGLTVSAYAAAKGGVTQLTKALSDECASKGVNVNAQLRDIGEVEVELTSQPRLAGRRKDLNPIGKGLNGNMKPDSPFVHLFRAL